MEVWVYYEYLEDGNMSIISYHGTEEAADEKWELQEKVYDQEGKDFDGGITSIKIEKVYDAVSALNAALYRFLPIT